MDNRSGLLDDLDKLTTATKVLKMEIGKCLQPVFDWLNKRLGGVIVFKC